MGVSSGGPLTPPWRVPASASSLAPRTAHRPAPACPPVCLPQLLDEARDKILMGAPRALTQSAEARKLTAYHEGGHALVALYTPGAKPIHKVREAGGWNASAVGCRDQRACDWFFQCHGAWFFQYHGAGIPEEAAPNSFSL